ncbi:MAG: thiol-disulfide oxidoreductase ResA [Bacilli bacterium]
MKKYRTFIRITILFILILAIGFTIFQSIFRKDHKQIQANEQAPNFTLGTLDGKRVTLSELEGKGVVLNFWGTYCPPCVREMPLMEEKYHKYKEQGLEVVAVNVAESKVSVSAFVRRHDLSFPIVLDPKRELTKQYNIGPMPATIFIRPDGTIQPVNSYNTSTNKAIFVGEMTDEVLEMNIKGIMP